MFPRQHGAGDISWSEHQAAQSATPLTKPTDQHLHSIHVITHKLHTVPPDVSVYHISVCEVTFPMWLYIIIYDIKGLLVQMH